MLQAEGLSYRHTRTSALLAGIDCQIRPGEVVGLPGPSGCGKTTLGRLLAGYLRPESGTLRCDGSPLPASGFCPVQMVFQHPELAVNPRWKIHDILAESHSEYPALLGDFGIFPDWLERYPHELSGGELQRITVIRAMHPLTRYLIADEITASLDAATQALIWHALLAWARRSKVGILVISHDRRLLCRICDRVDERFLRDPPESLASPLES